MANVQRKRSVRPELPRSPSKRSRDGTTRNRIALDASKEVVHQFLRRSRSSGSNLARQGATRFDGQETIGTIISDHGEGNGIVVSRPTEDESVSDTLAEMSVLSEGENSQNVVTSDTCSSRVTDRRPATEADPGTPRTARLGPHPTGLNGGLQRVPSVVFHYDPDRVSLAFSKPSVEDRTLSASVGMFVDDAADDADADANVIEASAGVGLRHEDDRPKKKKFKLRKSFKKFRRRLVKRQPKHGENMVALESQNGEAETFFRTAGATRHSEEMGDSLSSQDSVAQPVAEKKKPGMIQRISAWFVGKKESESLPVPQRKSDSEEQGLRRSASYRRAVDSGRFSGVYINGSSTDDEASEDDDLGEFSQEILADSAQDPAEIETEREKVVNRLQEMGIEIEQQFKDQLINTVKKLDIGPALQYPVFSKVVGALVEGSKMTTAGLMKLLVFGRQLVTGVPQELATMMEQYTSQAVEDYASDFIRSNGGWGGITDDTEGVTSSEETTKSYEV